MAARTPAMTVDTPSNSDVRGTRSACRRATTPLSAGAAAVAPVDNKTATSDGFHVDAGSQAAMSTPAIWPAYRTGTPAVIRSPP